MHFLLVVDTSVSHFLFDVDIYMVVGTTVSGWFLVERITLQPIENSWILTNSTRKATNKWIRLLLDANKLQCKNKTNVQLNRWTWMNFSIRPGAAVPLLGMPLQGHFDWEVLPYHHAHQCAELMIERLMRNGVWLKGLWRSDQIS